MRLIEKYTCCLPTPMTLASGGVRCSRLCSTRQLLRPSGQQCSHSGGVCPQIQGKKVYFNNSYDCMLTKNNCDLKWKIRHSAISTDRFMYGCKYSESSNCNYCGELDDLTHSFVTCSIHSGLFQLPQSLIRKLTPPIDKIPVWWYIIGIPARAGLDVNVRRLGNWMFAQTKIAIAYSRFNKNRSSGGTHCVVTFFKAKVISRVNVEYQFVRFHNTVCNFVEKWNTYNELCKVKNDNIVLTCRFKIVIFNIWYLRIILYFA